MMSDIPRGRTDKDLAKAGTAIMQQNQFPQGLMLDHISPATRLLEKRRQMFEVQEALEAQKEEFARRENAFRRREETLRRKDLELQESLIKFNKFLQENESKRSRAVKRAADERKQREQKEQEIAKLKVQYSDKLEEEARLKDDLEKYRRYQDFLSKVVEAATDDYPEIHDLLNRYRTLKEANRDLVQAQERDDKETALLREEYATYTKARITEMFDGNNEMSTQQKMLEKSIHTAYQLQVELDSRVHRMSDRALEMGQVLGAVANILDRCERGSTIKRASQAQASGGGGTGGGGVHNSSSALEAEEQVAKERIEEIGNYMMDYRATCTEWKALVETEIGKV